MDNHFSDFRKEMASSLSECVESIEGQSDEQKRDRKAIALRLCDPWPKWTIKLLLKYIHPYLPTISEAEVRNCIDQLRHEFGGTESSSKIEPELNSIVFAKIAGHFLAQIKKMEEVPVEELPHGMEDFRFHLKPIYKNISKMLEMALTYPSDKLQKCLLAFTKAYTGTYDKKGLLKTNRSRPIYWAILFRWPIVEKMHTLSELENFISIQVPDHKFDRKNLEFICKQIGLRFRGRGRPKIKS